MSSEDQIYIDQFGLAQMFPDNIDIEFLVGSMPDYSVISQLNRIVSLPPFAGEKIRIMPDVHSGKSSVVGFTSTISSDKVVPNIVSGDIGCGVLVVEFKPPKKGVDFNKLDKFLHETIGDRRFAGREDNVPFELTELSCFDALPNKNTIPSSMGTLGSGNHFVEVAHGVENKSWYLLIHTGSRNLGTQIAKIYQEAADCGGTQGIPYDLKWCEGRSTQDYLHDLKLTQQFALANRWSIAKSIMKTMKWKEIDAFDTMHNYIDFAGDVPIVRKGSVSAKDSEKIVIPMNMAFGSFICVGKGAEDWNQSAPHGAGRIMSRADAKESLSMNDYRTAMKDVFSSTVSSDTIDEAPGAYKTPSEISAVLSEVVEIKEHIQSQYNFKN